MMDNRKYFEYFDIDETYFPCIDESAINAGVDWKKTYPHDTFIKLLKMTESMLAGATKRSVWIHGAYGTGKSQCAYALKKILEVPEDELKEYWDRYEPLKREMPLLAKLSGHKEKGILTVYRYASGNIDSPQQLFLAIQESVKAALEKSNIEYKGERTLKQAVIEWLQMPAQKAFVNSLLDKPEWKSLFAESSADEIINVLNKNQDISSLMDNIFKMAAKEGITALSLSAESLRDWLRDIIDINGIKIVFVWDEFSDFFRQNKNSLGEFQKIVSICEEAPFYLLVVTHPISSISSNDDSWKIVQQRFDRVEIELPENIAFDLIGHAFSVKQSATSSWNQVTHSLEGSLPNATKAVMKAANISDPNTIRNILPLQPIAALVLKNIAHAFQSNQRSMFDFIKTSHDTDVKAFQWFIKTYGPFDEENSLLTVDMLWDFFYVKGKEYLSPEIKLILDTFPQQTMLQEKEKRVLKTVLIMQAIDQRLGGTVSLLKPTDQNLSYAFEGIRELEDTAKNIAKALENKGVLISTPIGDGKKMYGAAVLAGDGAKIEAYKQDIRKQSSTAKLVEAGGLIPTSIGLTPALKLRYAQDIDTGSMVVATITDFVKKMDSLKTKDIPWRFYSILAVAKDDDEAQAFRNLIKKTIANDDYKNIYVIDALSSPLGLENFEQYIEYQAMSQYYQGNNGQQSKENNRKAIEILNRTWREKIHDGQFYVYSYANQDGEKAFGAANVQAILQSIVLTKYRYIFDFAKGLTETHLKLTNAKQVARCGITGEITGVIKGCEKFALGAVWGKDNYWEKPEFQNFSIVIIKHAIDNVINAAFSKNGQIAIGEIYDYLEDQFGFSPCNLSAFITGFLLKEYSSDPYRCINAEGYPEPMTPEKLAEMIGNYIGKAPKQTYIVKMTAEERAFYEATELAWSVNATACASPTQVSSLISNRIRELDYPVWCLEDVDTLGITDILRKYISLVQSDNKATHHIAMGIGRIMMQKPTLAENLKTQLTKEKCQEGMISFVSHFREGKLVSLSEQIHSEALLLQDVKKIFNIKHSALWDIETGKSELDKLIVVYQFVKQTNELLNVSCNTKEKAFSAWRDSLRFIGVSAELIKAKRPSLEKVFTFLLKIVNQEELLPDMIKDLYLEINNNKAELLGVLGDRVALFNEVYGVYLEGFSLMEKEEILNSLQIDMFVASASSSNQLVKTSAENFRKNQIKTQMFELWRTKTSSKSPMDWSDKHHMPILCLVEPDRFDETSRVFSVLNSQYQSDSDIKNVLSWIENNSKLLGQLNDDSYCEQRFVSTMLGDYAVVLPNVDQVRQRLEKMPISVYDWFNSPAVKEKIREMVDAEYHAGGSDRAVKLIENMGDAELKQRLTELVKKDVELGLRIICNGDK